MQLIPLGGPAVKIVSKTNLVSEGELSIVINPYSQIKGLGKLRKQKTHIVVASKESLEYFDAKSVDKEAFAISTPGEYEIKGVLFGSSYVGKGKEQALIFRMDVENVSLGFCVGVTNPDMDAIQKTLEGIDVLFVSIGGKGVIDAKQAMDIVTTLEPRLVIPLEYKSKTFPVSQDTSATFSKEFGPANTSTSSKFKLIKKELPATDRQLLLLE